MLAILRLTVATRIKFCKIVNFRVEDHKGGADTAFHVPAEKIDRLPACYSFKHQTRSLEIFDNASDSAWAYEPPAESEGGGLVSTIDDYFTFSRMMLNRGDDRHSLRAAHDGLAGTTKGIQRLLDALAYAAME